jgi:chorismate synthase
VFRFLTAGESHGPELTAIIEGVPSGLRIRTEYIDEQLGRRQGGYGRGARQKIETDTIAYTSGVRFGYSTGNPITLVVKNRDWANWTTEMSAEPLPEDAPPLKRESVVPRPGHADYAGMIKYNHPTLRPVLERASARNTATLVAVGAVARLLLGEFGITIGSHVVSIGGIRADIGHIDLRDVAAAAEASPVRVADKQAEEKIIAAIDEARSSGDTLGGVFEVIAMGSPVGLGTYAHWDRKLDGRIAQALMSIQAIKGVEIGMGFAVADVPGSQVHDEFRYDDEVRFTRGSNNAGGTEGGVSNGEPIIVRAAMKPIATLMKPLQSVNMDTKQAVPAFAERSDVCAVPAAAVIGEAMVAIVIAEAFCEKFGSDSMVEMRAHFDAYQKMVSDRAAMKSPSATTGGIQP